MCLRTLKILVVDDSEDTLAMLRAALLRKGYDVTTAADGFDALHQIEVANIDNRPYDAVVLDYAMPGMDGLTCALKIRAAEESKCADCKHVKIGFLTAHPDLQPESFVMQFLAAKSASKTQAVEVIKDFEHWIGLDKDCPQQQLGA